MHKLVTIYTDTHQRMYENYFLPSYQEHLSSNYMLFAKKAEQKCPTGTWQSEGFDAVTLEKLKWIADNIDIENKNLLVFSDCDVQFFKPLNFTNENIIENTIYFQLDPPHYVCTGFFVCKQTESVLNFFKTAINMLNNSLNTKNDDQSIINSLIMSEITKQTLPTELYWSAGHQCGIWNGQQLTPPTQIIMHHANFTIGVPNKELLLESVKSIVRNYNN
jgi:hypothetical protein